MDPIASPTADRQVAVAPTTDEDGGPVFSVLAKRTYAIRAGGPAERVEDRPLLESDVYYGSGDPETCSVRYEAETAPYKLETDVVLVGSAFAPQGDPVRSMTVSVRVGGHRHDVRIVGDRRCLYRPDRPPEVTDPEPFTELPLRYERAYGGRDAASDPEMPFVYPRNHVGRGIAVRNTRESVDGLPLPNLEDPDDPLTPDRVVLGDPARWPGQPLPRGVGWFAKTWYPRCSFLGVVPGPVALDTVMPEERMGLVPEGQVAAARRRQLPAFDVRFNNGASVGLALPFLAGDEAVELSGVVPSGDLAFRLPGEVPSMALDIGSGPEELTPVLHTVLFRMEEWEMDLVWRGALEYPGVEWLPEMTKLEPRVR